MAFSVIFHIDEPSKWDLLLRNVRNLIKAADPKVSEIEVLANSEAVGFYASPNGDGELMKELALAGVRFVACSNALGGMEITRERLPRFVEVVPVGVIELIEKQNQGFAYIKP